MSATKPRLLEKLPAPAIEPSALGTPLRSAHDRGVGYLLSLQSERGDFEGEMVWNTMILSQHVIVRTVVGQRFTESERRGIIRHYEVSKTSDGGFGMHPESGGYVFFTTLAYVALRLLGVGPDEPLTKRAREWLRRRPGGVLSIPTWGKYWLSFIGLYEYEGVNPCPPEMYALPSWLPIHPSKYYCHTRNIYMGLAYLYGSKFRADLGPIAKQLRSELYEVPYEDIDFSAHRHDVAITDLHVAPGAGVRASADAMTLHEKVHSKSFRRRALAHCFERIVYEQRQSRYQGLSPVNGLLNCLALFAADPEHPDLAPSVKGVEAWKWEDAAEGIRYCGARSNTWDTSLAMQAILDGPNPEKHKAELLQCYRFLDGAQMVEELPRYQDEHRDPALGGWCFSDGVHRWPVSDCTAEALAAITRIHASGALAPSREERISDERLMFAARFILKRQNPDGGFGTYESRRGSTFLENINNTEMYGNCMTERSYIECTASSVAALSHIKAAPPVALTDDDAVAIDRAIARGISFLKSCQRPDGSFLGFWGINFTYAIFHVMKGLRAAGVPASDPVLVRAAEWLVNHQRSDGGWGEHYSSCLTDRYVEHPQSQVVMTSWAVLALMEIVGTRSRSVVRGVEWLKSRQLPDGSWPEQALNGVFFGSAMLDYRLYKSYFPVWALGKAG